MRPLASLAELLTPEDAFIAWLIGLPDGSNPAEAALAALKDMPPGHARLRALLAEAAALRVVN